MATIKFIATITVKDVKGRLDAITHLQTMLNDYEDNNPDGKEITISLGESKKI